jgi:uncharacterized protein
MTTNERNTATLLHLSALAQYLFPLANYIIPTVIWSSKKENSPFIDQTGRRVMNFQLSILVYMFLLGIVGVFLVLGALINHGGEFTIDCDEIHIGNFMAQEWTAWFVTGIVSFVLLGILKFAEFVLIIYGAVKASNGLLYSYPLSIPFFKVGSIKEDEKMESSDASNLENHHQS